MKTNLFSDLPICGDVLENLPSLGYKKMTPIQKESLAPILAKKDVMAQAKTGSGKTAAFGIGILSNIDMRQNRLHSLILCPTRELADQVAKDIKKLGRLLPNLKVITLTGGVPFGPQAASLEHGGHIAVGTPGRVVDHLRKKTLDLRGIQNMTLDEADRMLEMGFSEDLEKIVSNLPKRRQTLLFSATFPENIQELSASIQKNPINVKTDEVHNDAQIEQIFYEVSPENRTSLLIDLLIHHQPETSVVFCNTKIDCQQVADELSRLGFKAQALHGDLLQKERDNALALFANKSRSILIATDVAARGLDIKDLSAVFNLELAKSVDVHTHRIGRTGRAGNKGIAISLFSAKEKHRVVAIEQAQNKPVHLGNKKNIHNRKPIFSPPMVAFKIAGGKKDKLRPTDILGAITSGQRVLGKDVGKIDIFDFHSFVAVRKAQAELAFEVLTQGKIKSRDFKVRRV